MLKNTILIICFLLSFKLYAQPISSKDTLKIKGKYVGFIDTIISEKSDIEITKTYRITLTKPVFKDDINQFEDSIVRKYPTSYFKYNIKYENVGNLELAGYYMIKSADAKNASLTFALLGSALGSALIYTVNPAVGFGVTGLSALISLIQNYRGNNFLKKSGQLLMTELK